MSLMKIISDNDQVMTVLNQGSGSLLNIYLENILENIEEWAKQNCWRSAAVANFVNLCFVYTFFF